MIPGIPGTASLNLDHHIHCDIEPPSYVGYRIKTANASAVRTWYHIIRVSTIIREISIDTTAVDCCAHGICGSIFFCLFFSFSIFHRMCMPSFPVQVR